MEKPLTLKHSDEQYLMRFQISSGYYVTDRPVTSVPKIGTKHPQKKKFTLEQLLTQGWKPYVENKGQNTTDSK